MRECKLRQAGTWWYGCWNSISIWNGLVAVNLLGKPACRWYGQLCKRRLSNWTWPPYQWFGLTVNCLYDLYWVSLWHFVEVWMISCNFNDNQDLIFVTKSLCLQHLIFGSKDWTVLNCDNISYLVAKIQRFRTVTKWVLRKYGNGRLYPKILPIGL